MANGFQPTQLQQIGQALGGLGAGIQGNLPQFQQVQAQRRQQAIQQQQAQQKAAQEAEKERQQTAFTDADAALKLFNQDDLDGVVQLGMNRLQLLQQFPGADPSDTQRLTQLATAARNGSEEAKGLLKNELESAVRLGKATGVLGDEEIKGQSPLGKLAADFKNGVLTDKQFEDQVANLDPDPSLDFLQRIVDGDIQTIQTDNQGNFFDLTGAPIELGADETLIEGATLTGNKDEFGLGDSEARDLRNSEVAAKTFIATAGDAINMLNDNPDINTFVGRAASIANNLQQEARAIGRALGVDIDEGLLDPATQAETFDKLGIDNQRMRSMITSLAYQAAAAAGQTGRGVSDRDVRRFVEEIGASAADPRAFAQALIDVAKRTERRFKINYKIRTDEDYPDTLGLENLPGFTAEPIPGAEEEVDITQLSDEELLRR